MEEIKSKNVQNYVMNDMVWKVDLPKFLKEISECSINVPYAASFRILAQVLKVLTERAIEINDPALNIIMLNLGLYEGAHDKNAGEVISKLRKLITDNKKIGGLSMIDDKKIEEAAINKCGFISSEFYSGAKWAINEFLKDLWNPAKEEPNHEAIRTYILGKTKASESGVLPMLLRPNTNWKEFVVSHGVTHWLYVDDLLPKEGGNHD